MCSSDLTVRTCIAILIATAFGCLAAADTIAFTKAVGEVTVTVGKSSILLSETSPMQAIATNGAALLLDAWLFFVVKSYPVRDYALAAGYDRDPDFVETAAASRATQFATPFSHYGGLEQSVLVKYYLYHGVEVADEEIDAHFHENAEVLADLEERTSPEKVHRQIQQTLTFQKVPERRSKFFDGPAATGDDRQAVEHSYSYRASRRALRESGESL